MSRPTGTAIALAERLPDYRVGAAGVKRRRWPMHIAASTGTGDKRGKT
jgi:hypothetical protein